LTAGSPEPTQTPSLPTSVTTKKKARRRRVTSPFPKHPLVGHLRRLAKSLPDFAEELIACAEEVNYKAHRDGRVLDELVATALARGLHDEEDICDDLKIPRADLRDVLASLESRGLAHWVKKGLHSANGTGGGHVERLWYPGPGRRKSG
jgi:hypothetical protein